MSLELTACPSAAIRLKEPAKVGEAEMVAAIDAAIAQTGASGQADMGQVSALVKRRLTP